MRAVTVAGGSGDAVGIAVTAVTAQISGIALCGAGGGSDVGIVTVTDGGDGLGIALTAELASEGRHAFCFTGGFRGDTGAVAVIAAEGLAEGDLQIVQLAVDHPVGHTVVAQIAEGKIRHQRIAGHVLVIVVIVQAALQLEIGDSELTVDPQADGAFPGEGIVDVGQLHLIVILNDHIRGGVVAITAVVQIIGNGEAASVNMPQSSVANDVVPVFAKQEAGGAVFQRAVFPFYGPVSGGVQLNDIFQFQLQSIGIEIAVLDAVASLQSGTQKGIQNLSVGAPGIQIFIEIPYIVLLCLKRTVIDIANGSVDSAVCGGVGQRQGHVLIAPQGRNADAAVVVTAADHDAFPVGDVGGSAADSHL